MSKRSLVEQEQVLEDFIIKEPDDLIDELIQARLIGPTGAASRSE